MAKKIFFLFVSFFLLTNTSSFAKEQKIALCEEDKAQTFSMPQKEGENTSKEPSDEELLAPMIEEEDSDNVNEVFESEEFSQR